MVPPIPPEASKEIEFIKGLVARHFPVYDVRVAYDVVEFFVHTDSATLEQNFDDLREEMAQHNYIPMILYDKGEHIVTVAKKPTSKYRSTRVNLAMLIITLFSTILAGTIEWGGYENVATRDMFAPTTIMMGALTFALPLMSILSVHELAHYFAARRRNVAASLPFFIPSIPPLGTFGAFISLRDPIPNKKTLLEVGVAGPLAGFLLTIPIGILGLILTNDGAKLAPINVPPGGITTLILPVFYSGLQYLVPLKGDFLVHPTAFAAWVGFLVTALNLLPVGQLDGGHIARALLGSKARYFSWATIAALVALGLSGVYLGWLLFAVIILFLGARHPPPLNDITKLDVKRKALGLAAFVVLVVAFVPIPLVLVSPTYSFEMANAGPTNATVSPGESYTFSMLMTNTGNAYNNIEFAVDSAPFGWSVAFKQQPQNASAYASKYDIGLNASQNATMEVKIVSPTTSSFGSNSTVTIKATSLNKTSIIHTTTYNLSIGSPPFTFWVVNDGVTIAPGTWGNVTVQANNTSPVTSNITLDTNTAKEPPFITPKLIANGQNSTGPLNLTVPGNGTATFYVLIHVDQYASAGMTAVGVDTLYRGVELQTIEIRVDVA